jgi:Tfp pilus assembly protein PilN
VVAGVGVLPILAARAADHAHRSPGQGAFGAVVPLAILCVGVLAFAVAQIAPRRSPVT